MGSPDKNEKIDHTDYLEKFPDDQRSCREMT